jgi:hypothetical protein
VTGTHLLQFIHLQVYFFINDFNEYLENDCFPENAFRINEEESTELPTIIAQVIGYDHAKIIFKMMEGNKIVDSEEWKGAMDVNYTFGGKLANNQLFFMLFCFFLNIVKNFSENWESMFTIVVRNLKLIM